MQVRKQNIADSMIYGKVPPQCIDVEKSLLGCIVQFGVEVYQNVSDLLKPQCFYAESNQIIFEAIRSIADRNQAIDLLTVVTELRESGNIENVGGPFYISTLTNGVSGATISNSESHAKLIVEKFMLREVIRISYESLSIAYNEGVSPFTLIDEMSEQLASIDDHMNFGDLKSISQVSVEAIKDIERSKALYDEHGSTPVTGVNTGLTELNLLTLGWQPGNLIIIAARPSAGKTAFALNMAESAAISFKGTKKKVAMFCLEMKAKRLVGRMIARGARIQMQELKSGAISDDELKRVYAHCNNHLSKLGIDFDDNSVLTIRSLKSKTKKLARKKELGLIIVDYLQLMKPESGGNREQEIAGMSRELKMLAQDYEVPVIVLSQLSREIEKRDSGVPQLSDLRESGAIEQDADDVLFLYGPTEKQLKANEEAMLKGDDYDPNLKNKRWLKIAKQRDGMLETIELKAEMAYQNFESYLQVEQEYGKFRPLRREEMIQSALPTDDDAPF